MEQDTHGTFTDKGWPRPIIQGWPIPWVSPVEELKRVHPGRMDETVEFALCEICGEGSDPDTPVYLLVNTEKPPETLEGMVIQAMDNAVMHERCARLAVGRCPALRNLKALSSLLVYRTEYRYIQIFYPEENDEQGVLGVEGQYATQVTRPFL